MKDDDLLTPEEFAKKAGCSVSTVRRRLKGGLLPAVQEGGKGTLWKIDFAAFRSLFHGRTDSTVEEAATEPVSKDRSRSRPRWMARLSVQ